MFALLLAGVMACAPLVISGPAEAANGSRIISFDVGAANGAEIQGSGDTVGTSMTPSAVISVGYADGRTRVFAVGRSRYGNFSVGYFDDDYRIATTGAQGDTGLLRLPGEPGVKIGLTDFQTDPSSFGLLARDGSLYDAKIFNGLIVGLANPPETTQASTVAAVPTTGAPSSDLALPAALLAAGMVGGGLLVRKRKDRNRA